MSQGLKDKNEISLVDENHKQNLYCFPEDEIFSKKIRFSQIYFTVHWDLQYYNWFSDKNTVVIKVRGRTVLKLVCVFRATCAS